MANSGGKPSWSMVPVPSSLIAAMLAGGWDGASAVDRAILELDANLTDSWPHWPLVNAKRVGDQRPTMVAQIGRSPATIEPRRLVSRQQWRAVA
jgi:hypothetical protein